VAIAPARLESSFAPGFAPPRLPRMSFESLPELSHPAPKPRSFWRMALLSGASAALAVFCVQVVRVSQGAPAAREAAVPALPRVPQIYAAREIAIVDPLTAAGKAGEDRQAVAVAVSSLGRLRVPAAARGVLVDGVPHRVTAGVVLVTCGTHRIKLASEAAQTVAITCGGTTVL